MTSIRFSGISSGLDTESIVQQLMQIERRPITILNNKKQNFQTEQKAWQEINSNLSTLKSKLTSLKLQADFQGVSASTTDSTIVTAIAENTAAKASYQIDVQQMAQAHRVASARQADISTSLGFTGSFTINDKIVTIDNTNDSLSGIRDAINAVEGIGVQASIVDNTLVLTASESGVDNAITATDTDGILTTLGVDDGFGTLNTIQDAKNAKFKINGLSIEQSSNVVDTAVEGVKFTLLKEGTATVQTSIDTDGIIAKIKDLVDQYNKTYSSMSSYMGKNETTGKANLLSGDMTLTRLQLYLRDSFTGKIDTGTSFDHLGMIGINTDRYGKMTIDETKLKDALENNLDDVMNMFTARTESAGYDGITIRLDSWLDGMLNTKGILPERLEYYTSVIKDIDDKVSNLEYLMETKEKNLYQKWTEVEKALGSMQSQSDWLSSTTMGMFSS